MMRKRSIISLLLAFCLCFVLSMPVLAANTDEFMPSEIVNDLNGVNVISDKDGATNDNVIEQISKPASLGIDTINIDMHKVHQTYPLLEEQILELKKHGYTDDDITSLDMGDFFNIESTWMIDSDIIDLVIYLYPELEDNNISNWTYGDLKSYASIVDAKKYAPTVEQQKEFESRNITISDAKILLKDYYDYDNILAQSDEQLAKDLEEYYQFSIENIYTMAAISSNSDVELYINPSTNPDSNYYVQFYFPGHGDEWIHKNAVPASMQVALQQAGALRAAYKKIYNTDQDFSTTNIYGGYSISSQGAHEGIDFSKPSNLGSYCSIYSIANGSVLTTGNSLGQLPVYVSSMNVTMSYLHMSTIKPVKGQAVSVGEQVGNQGNVGAHSSGAHVHLQFESGKTVNVHSAWRDHNLESLSPYTYIMFFLSNN